MDLLRFGTTHPFLLISHTVLILVVRLHDGRDGNLVGYDDYCHGAARVQTGQAPKPAAGR
jgi:hypothetical protein